MNLYYQHGGITVYHGDCMDLLASLPDKAFELAIVDPPYGLGESAARAAQRCRKTSKWKSARPPQYGGANSWDDARPGMEYFEALKVVAENQIIWGANHFGLMPSSPGWIVWFKKRLDEVNDFSDAELAFSSFNKGVRLFHLPWIGFGAVNAKEQRIHPTQKPVALYKWLLKNYAKPGDTILDTHGGSLSIAIACHDMGFELTVIEQDEEYLEKAVKRLSDHQSQLSLAL